jgi:hypothetical protein
MMTGATTMMAAMTMTQAGARVAAQVRAQVVVAQVEVVPTETAAVGPVRATTITALQG